MYTLLFLLYLATVGRLVDYRITLLIVAAVTAVTAYKIFAKVDYSLLLTFVVTHFLLYRKLPFYKAKMI